MNVDVSHLSALISSFILIADALVLCHLFSRGKILALVLVFSVSLFAWTSIAVSVNVVRVNGFNTDAGQGFFLREQKRFQKFQNIIHDELVKLK